jgi:branched-chain amino acid transport system ATP-binding protein
MSKALDIIQREHRALAAVLYCYEQVMTEIRRRQLEPDYALFDAIVEYVQDFPDRYHHPKEDELLFPMVRRRAPETAQTLDELQRQHHDGVRVTNELKWRLADWKKYGADGFRAFDEATKSFLEFQRKHIALEERNIIPAAREKLTAEDWARIDAGFAQNEDPMFGRQPRAAFDRLFQRIAELAPAPHGLGQRKEPKPGKRDDGADFRMRIIDHRWM